MDEMVSISDVIGPGPSVEPGHIALLVMKDGNWVALDFTDWERFHDHPARLFTKIRFALEKAERGVAGLTKEEYLALGLDKIPKFDRREPVADAEEESCATDGEPFGA